MPEIRQRIERRLTDQERARHALIREQVAQEKPRLSARARAKKAELMELRHALILLKKERETRGLSLAEVAERSGIDTSGLSQLENEPSANPTLDTLMRIAEAIGVKLTIGVVNA